MGTKSLMLCIHFRSIGPYPRVHIDEKADARRRRPPSTVVNDSQVDLSRLDSYCITFSLRVHICTTCQTRCNPVSTFSLSSDPYWVEHCTEAGQQETISLQRSVPCLVVVPILSYHVYTAFCCWMQLTFPKVGAQQLQRPLGTCSCLLQKGLSHWQPWTTRV